MQERKGRKASSGGEKYRAYRSLTQAARAERKAAGGWVGKTAGNWKTKMGNVEKTNKARRGSAGTVQNKRSSKVKSRNLLERKGNWRKCAANLLMKEMAGLCQKNRKVIRKLLEWKETGSLPASQGSYCSHASWSSGDVPSTGCWVIRVLLVVFFFAKITCKSCLLFFPSKGGIKLPPLPQYGL